MPLPFLVKYDGTLQWLGQLPRREEALYTIVRKLVYVGLHSCALLKQSEHATLDARLLRLRFRLDLYDIFENLVLGELKREEIGPQSYLDSLGTIPWA